MILFNTFSVIWNSILLTAVYTKNSFVLLYGHVYGVREILATKLLLYSPFWILGSLSGPPFPYIHFKILGHSLEKPRAASNSRTRGRYCGTTILFKRPINGKVESTLAFDNS